MSSPRYTQKQLRALLSYPGRTRKGNRLLQHVGRWILRQASRDHPVTAVLDDVFAAGYSSSLVSHLISYQEIKHFYFTYLDEIHDLMDEWEEQMGEPVKVKSHRTTWYAWFGFEATAYQIQQMIEEKAAGSVPSELA